MPLPGSESPLHQRRAFAFSRIQTPCRPSSSESYSPSLRSHRRRVLAATALRLARQASNLKRVVEHLQWHTPTRISHNIRLQHLFCRRVLPWQYDVRDTELVKGDVHADVRHGAYYFAAWALKCLPPSSNHDDRSCHAFFCQWCPAGPTRPPTPSPPSPSPSPGPGPAPGPMPPTPSVPGPRPTTFHWNTYSDSDCTGDPHTLFTILVSMLLTMLFYHAFDCAFYHAFYNAFYNVQ